MAIEFENTPVEWKNEGAEPSDDLKTNGYQPGYKPPAQVFNYLQNNTSKCLTELQAKVSDLSELDGDAIKGIKGNGTTIVPSSTGIVNITPNNIGAAPSTHYHNASQITSGVLPVERGGTGATTIEEVCTNLGTASIDLSNVDDTVFAEKAVTAGVSGSPGTGGVGKSLAGQTVYPTKNNSVEAGTGAEIFNDYRGRTYNNGDSEPIQGNIASGEYSHAEGQTTTASGTNSHAEGIKTTASGSGSHAEGGSTVANDYYAHAEGQRTTASGQFSHAEGSDTEASGDGSHAEGYLTKASGRRSHAEGSGTEASGEGSHAEGYSTKASGEGSHAEGEETEATGHYSHAEGYSTKATGSSSHAEGYGTTATGGYCHAGGRNTEARTYQLVHGRYNIVSAGASGDTDTTGNIFIIGNGSSNTARGNAFRVTTAGGVYGLSAYSSSGADYAEYFEWLDGNPEDENRRGYFVTLDGDKIRKATDKDEYILGVVSATPAVEGDTHSENWCDMYLRDIFGEKLIEVVEVEETTDENGEVVPAHTEQRWILNPEYDSSLSYENRKNRKEWSPVGMMGKLVVIDDGTCQINGYCKPNENGIATVSETGYRVMKRLDKNHVRIVLK